MKENAVKRSNNYMPYNRSGVVKTVPGKPVGVVNIGQNIVYFTVSPYRKDFNQVVDQTLKIKYSRLPKYEQSLFHSCFRNW